MIQHIYDYLASFFQNPSCVGIGLAVIFGLIWIACYRPPLFSHIWVWALLPASAILTYFAIAFIQVPLTGLIRQTLHNNWSQEVLLRHILLSSVPALVLCGLVQEGAKFVPVVACWWIKGKNIDPCLGLQIGAVAGVGFGIFEAQQVHNAIFASGWTWENVQLNGVMELTGFWESLFIVAMHTTATAFAGYGLAKGWGWQFYLLAVLLHALLYYIHLLFQAQILSNAQVELAIGLYAQVATLVAIMLGEREAHKAEEHESTESSPAD